MEKPSAFMEKDSPPDNGGLSRALGKTYPLWKEISDYVISKYPKATAEWNFPGAKYGWSYRIKDKKRAIIYLVPRDNFFQSAFVFGAKATDVILNSYISGEIKSQLKAAKVYSEGRGIRVDVKARKDLDEIRFLVDTKLGL